METIEAVYGQRLRKQANNFEKAQLGDRFIALGGYDATRQGTVTHSDDSEAHLTYGRRPFWHDNAISQSGGPSYRLRHECLVYSGYFIECDNFLFSRINGERQACDYKAWVPLWLQVGDGRMSDHRLADFKLESLMDLVERNQKAEELLKLAGAADLDDQESRFVCRAIEQWRKGARLSYIENRFHKNELGFGEFHSDIRVQSAPERDALLKKIGVEYDLVADPTSGRQFFEIESLKISEQLAT